MIYLLPIPESEDEKLFFTNWGETFANLKTEKKPNASKFYTRLFNRLEHVPLESGAYDIFLTDQRTGTCSVSCYHFYFTYKIGEVAYNRIKTIVSTVLLYSHCVKSQDLNLLGEQMLTKKQT